MTRPKSTRRLKRAVQRVETAERVLASVVPDLRGASVEWCHGDNFREGEGAVIATSLDRVLVRSRTGRVYWLHAARIEKAEPQGGSLG